MKEGSKHYSVLELNEEIEKNEVDIRHKIEIISSVKSRYTPLYASEIVMKLRMEINELEQINYNLKEEINSKSKLDNNCVYQTRWLYRKDGSMKPLCYRNNMVCAINANKCNWYRSRIEEEQ